MFRREGDDLRRLGVGHVVVEPDVNVGVDVAGLGHQVSKRLAEMAFLGGKAMLLIECELFAERARAHGVGAMVQQHCKSLVLDGVSSMQRLHAGRTVANGY